MVISYSLIRLSPGDPAEARLGAGADPAAIDKLREDLGLNENAFTAFINYFTGVLQGDLGVSLANDLEVIEIIKRSFPVTLTYIVLSVFFAFIISIPIGTIIGWSNKASSVYAFRGITSIIQTSLLRCSAFFCSALNSIGPRYLVMWVNFQKISSIYGYR
jgi:peptide/nickel transport system permease protein